MVALWNLILFMIIEDPVLIHSIYHQSRPLMVGPHGRVIAYDPAKYLPIFHLLSHTDHLLGTTVIDAMAPSDDAHNATMALLRPTYVWITVRLALCNLSRFPFYRRFANISQAHVPGPASHEAMYCLLICWP
ncbi:hypothetical protein P692DRAFT_20841143 [Suillus brevipes Sb2]|nr:hypothetical protein P692DRAFT_20841143 [Suillus brevipes Sb2]